MSATQIRRLGPASWRLSLRKRIPSGVAERYRWLKYYTKKTRWGTEAVRNIVLDWKYGGYCGGRIRTRFAGSGAHPTVSSDYYQLARLFGPGGISVRPDDVLVDIGCGKGRILNFWLHSGLKNRIYGVELDPEFAGFAARRLAKFKNVTVLAGDAIENLPGDATLIFLYNPFEADVLEQLKARLREKYADRLGTIRVVYYACLYLEVFERDPDWVVQPLTHLPELLRSALITPKVR